MDGLSQAQALNGLMQQQRTPTVVVPRLRSKGSTRGTRSHRQSIIYVYFKKMWPRLYFWNSVRVQGTAMRVVLSWMGRRRRSRYKSQKGFIGNRNCKLRNAKFMFLLRIISPVSILFYFSKLPLIPSLSISSLADVLISRLSVQRVLEVNSEWTEDRHVLSQNTSMQYDIRVTCDSNYYGAGCADLCRPRDDQFGHYTCSSTGEIVCLSGWQGNYCTKRKYSASEWLRGFLWTWLF